MPVCSSVVHIRFGVSVTGVECVFSDESRFDLNTNDQQRRDWQLPGQRRNTNLPLAHHTARQPWVVVWGAISFHSRSPLVVICASLTTQRFVDDILRPAALPCISRNPGLTFEQDNSRPNMAIVFTVFFVLAHHCLGQQKRNIVLSLRTLEHNVYGIPTSSKFSRSKSIDRSCHDIPQEDIRLLYHSMPSRITAFIRDKSEPTHYWFAHFINIFLL